MSIRATSPYTIYLDADGNPLTGGYVYFGVAGSNPETTPIAIYWDEALTIAAAQPLRTINGFLMRNGSPGSIYTAAVYSVTVKNRNGVLVFSALTNPGIPVSVAMTPVCSAATLAAGLTAFGFSAFVQTLINDLDAATFLATLGVSAFIQTLLDDVDAATARATLGVDALVTVASTPYAPAAFNKSLTVIDCNMATALAADISAGATTVGQRVAIINRNAGLVTLTVTTGAATVVLAKGDWLVLVWNGTTWQYLGGSRQEWTYTSGTGATWLAPWTGTFDVTTCGGGGGGGGATGGASLGGGGGGGGGARKIYRLIAGQSCTYTAGGGGAGGAGGNGAAGTSSTFTDGTTQITASGGLGGGVGSSAPAVFGGRGGTGSNADWPLPGGGGTVRDDTVNVSASSGRGGNSPFGRGAQGLVAIAAGNNGEAYGGGGGGCFSSTPGTGGNGAAGFVWIRAA